MCVQANEPPLYIRRRMLSIQYSLRLGSSLSNPAYNTVLSPKFKASFSSKPNQIPTLGIRIAPEVEKIGFKRNTVSQLSVPATPVRFYELCDRFKNFYHIYTDGSKMGHRVSAALCRKRGTSAIRLPGATNIFNVELHAILLALDVVQRSKEKRFISLSDSYSSLIALGGSHVDQDTMI